MTTDTKISEKAIQLILDFEGMDVPWQWPGEMSGITIGHGYDLGYEANFEDDWRPFISEWTITHLQPAVGIKGQAAQAIAHRFREVFIPRAAAGEVFRKVTLPRETGRTLKAFPGSDQLNPDALGALVSLVFNRGTLIDESDRRREMRSIQRLLATSASLPPMRVKLMMMADHFEAMTRLWPNTRGLRRRRIAEAKLIRDSIPREALVT